MTSSSTAYTVYAKPSCPNCDRTKEYFDSKGITYTSVDITEVPASLEYITEELGYSQAPVVVTTPMTRTTGQGSDGTGSCRPA